MSDPISYKVLARKWRPRQFTEVVGQTAALKALTQALDQQRVHHAYLFTGTRGVGKTTLARILAKCLNCELGISAQPCGVCTACLEIDQGNYADLIEVDAASRSKVEETRELLDNVIYAPVHGRFKIYLIDEVHMLSNHSFNALLKTLEEPPEHVKFVLATTDPQRLPITVISRCLQFALTPLTPELIAKQLAHIVKAEKAQAEPAALLAVAHAAAGSMRDALSLLDQLLSYSAGELTLSDVHAVLGVPFDEQVCQLLQAIAQQDARAVVMQVAALAEQLPDLTNVLVSVIEFLQKIAFIQLLPSSLETSDKHYQTLSTLASHWQPEEVQTMYQLALHGRRDLPYAATVRSGLEMILLRLLTSVVKPGVKISAVENKPIEIKVPETKVAEIAENKVAETKSASPIIVEPAVVKKIDAETSNTDKWIKILERLSITGMTKAVAEHCVWLSADDNTIQLAIAPQHAALLSKQQEQRLQQALDHYSTQHGKKPRKLQVVVQDLATITPAKQRETKMAEQQEQAKETVLADAGVKAIMEAFDATLSITINKEER